MDQGLESQFGCDSIIIFKKGNTVRIGLFEAKWPRHSNGPLYCWDSINRNKKSAFYQHSRFSSQIVRQRKWIKSGAVIWEMFFNEEHPGKEQYPFDTFGSKCLLHFDASDYLQKRKKSFSELWNNQDLLNVLPYSINFRRLVYNILRGKIGHSFSIKEGSVTISSVDSERITVPLDIGQVGSLGDLIHPYGNSPGTENSVLEFMERNGLNNYISIDVNE